MLKLKDISIKYGKVSIIELLSYEFKSGNLYLLYGGNGTGKTTLLKLISGLIYKSEGFISIDREKIFYLPVNAAYPPYMKSHKYLEYINQFYKSPILNQLIQRYNLENKYIFQLSKGNKVKLGIIEGLIMNQDIYLFDEVLDGLDDSSKKELKSDIRRLLDENKLIIMATHENGLYKDIKPIKLIIKDRNLHEKTK